MAYRITKSRRVTEDLELCGESGEVIKTLHIDISIDPIIGEFNKRAEELKKAERDIKFCQRKNDAAGFEKAAEVYGNAILNVFSIIFGERNTNELLEFYENRYTDMLFEIYPFISTAIIPAINKAAEAKKAQAMSVFGGNRNMRRKK